MNDYLFGRSTTTILLQTHNVQKLAVRYVVKRVRTDDDILAKEQRRSAEPGEQLEIGDDQRAGRCSRIVALTGVVKDRMIGGANVFPDL